MYLSLPIESASGSDLPLLLDILSFLDTLSHVRKKITEFQVFNSMFMQTIDFSCVKESYRALRLELEIWTAMKEKTSLTFLPEKFSYIKKNPLTRMSVEI